MRSAQLLMVGVAWAVLMMSGCGGDNSPESPIDGSVMDQTDQAPMTPDAQQPPPVETPACADVRFPVSLPAEVNGDTELGDDTLDPAPCVQDGTTGSNDFIAFFVAPKDGRFRFTTEGSNFDTVMHARKEDCAGTVIDCNDDDVEQASGLELALEEGERIVLVVDGFNRAMGQVVLRVETKETLCDDGLDGDNDGATDCEDTDCFIACEDPMTWPADWAQFEDEVLVETNRVRAAGANCGGQQFPPVGPLEMNRFLRYSSRLHSRDMGLNNYFEHESQDGRSPGDRMAQAGFEGGGPTGENIAAGQNTPADVVDSWVNSPGHCRNMMDPDYHVLGVGFAIVEGSRFERYWTQNFGGSH